MSSLFVRLMDHLLFIWNIQVALGETYNLDRHFSSAPDHVRVVFKIKLMDE